MFSQITMKTIIPISARPVADATIRITYRFSSTRKTPPADEAGIRAMISRASWTIDTMADVYGGAKMGTTMVMAYIDGNDITVIHCSDSRYYVYDRDWIFLCSDGVYPCIAPDILRDRMMDDKPMEDIMDTVKFMCEKFSDDNYSAILIKID